MSEAAPGLPDSAEFATPERAQLAEAMRELIDAVMVSRDAGGDELLGVADDVRRLAFRLSGGTQRTQDPGYEPRSHGDYLPRSPVVGEASPLSPRLDWDVVDGRVEARGTFTAAFEGPPGFVHGGMIALAFDEILGIANIAAGHPGMTGTLTIRYRRPTPLYRPLRFRAWVDRVEGRRIMSKGEVWDGDVLTAESHGIFVQPRPELAAEYFGPRGTEDGPA
jgi:acyl-coenzyme A thioesterase PaaI-like protein